MLKTLPILALAALSALAQHDGNTISANVVALTGAATGATKAYRFNTLLKLASDTGIVPALDTANITLFAPTDDAFKTLTAVPSDNAIIKDILTYHVTPGAFPADKLAAYQVVPTLLNRQGSPFVQFADATTAQPIAVTKAADGVTVSFNGGKAKVIDSIPSKNGVIHVLGDAVLLPPKKVSETAANAKLNQLVAALTKAKLVETVDGAKGVTIFAPTDAAFEAIKDTVAKLTDDQLKQVLTYHVVPTVAYSTGLPASLDAPTLSGSNKVTVKKSDSGVMVNDAKVIAADVFTNNGVVHVIDKVLIPASFAAAPAATASSSAKPTATAAGSTSATAGSSASSLSASAGVAAAIVAAAAFMA